MKAMELLYEILGLIVLIIFIKLTIEMIKSIIKIIIKTKNNIKSINKIKVKNNAKDIYNTNNEINSDYIRKENFPYRKKYLLTKNELEFYKCLKIIADELNLCVLSKIRLADLIEIYGHKNNSEYFKYFGKIKAKHIDFALAKKENLEIILLIELDDFSHNRQDRKSRDEFINEVCKQCNYKILHTQDNILLKEKIISKICE